MFMLTGKNALKKNHSSQNLASKRAPVCQTMSETPQRKCRKYVRRDSYHSKYKQLLKMTVTLLGFIYCMRRVDQPLRVLEGKELRFVLLYFDTSSGERA